VDRILATYRLRASRDRARAEAEDVCIEQTVEVHRSLVSEPRFEDRILGRVESLVEIGGGVHEAVISYPQRVTAWQIPQLMHVLYGNVSLKRHVRLEALELPRSFTARFPGPSHSIRGVRAAAGVHGRPLLAAALKPMGLSSGELADLARRLAEGGIDIVKDDHGLADHEFCTFEDRLHAVCEALSSTPTLYLPSITDRFDLLSERVDRALSAGAAGLLTSPLVTGLDAVRFLAGRRSERPMIMAHPALAGAFFSTPDHGISPAVLLGTLMRLAGADMVIFPTHGGRFPLGPEDCRAVAGALRRPLPGLAPALPVVAGGVDVERVPELGAEYGEDAVVLIGSRLYTQSPDVTANARRFASLVRAAAGSRD
jgi:ribulose-bisphosphate carboxylase large chain